MNDELFISIYLDEDVHARYLLNTTTADEMHNQMLYI